MGNVKKEIERNFGWERERKVSFKQSERDGEGKFNREEVEVGERKRG